MTHRTDLLRKIAWTLLAGFLSFTVTGLFDKVLNVSLADQLIVTIVIGGVALMVQYLADVEHRLNELARVEREAADDLRRSVQVGFEGVDEATDLMSDIERSVIPDDVLKQLIRRSAQVTPSTLPLAQFLAGSETRRLAETLQSLVSGTEVFYEGEDREFILALARGVKNSLFAVSWATTNAGVLDIEAGFWLSDLGARYLKLQRAAASRGVEIKRIFIVESPVLMTRPELRRVVMRHLDAGVEVRFSADGESAQDGGQSDFIVFDEEVCYDTTLVKRHEAPSAPWLVTTRMVFDEGIARHRATRFRELWDRALPVDDPKLG